MRMILKSLGVFVLIMTISLFLSRCSNNQGFGFNLQKAIDLGVLPESAGDENPFNPVEDPNNPNDNPSDDTPDDDPDDIPDPNPDPECVDVPFTFVPDNPSNNGALIVKTSTNQTNSNYLNDPWHHQTGMFINVPNDGLYQIYFREISEGPENQPNESVYVLIKNSLNPNGYPEEQPSQGIPNCDARDSNGNLINGVHILEDSNNSSTYDSSPIYLGTYKLKAGSNIVEVFHYCGLWRNIQDGVISSGFCPTYQDFHNYVGVMDGGCESGNANSVHFEVTDGLCVNPL